MIWCENTVNPRRIKLLNAIWNYHYLIKHLHPIVPFLIFRLNQVSVNLHADLLLDHRGQQLKLLVEHINLLLHHRCLLNVRFCTHDFIKINLIHFSIEHVHVLVWVAIAAEHLIKCIRPIIWIVKIRSSDLIERSLNFRMHLFAYGFNSLGNRFLILLMLFDLHLMMLARFLHELRLLNLGRVSLTAMIVQVFNGDFVSLSRQSLIKPTNY